jgi:fructose transport system permease protein
LVFSITPGWHARTDFRARASRPNPTARAWCRHILNRTPFGRHIYATGDDEEAARLAGIRTNRVLLSAYAIAGLICAFGGWQLIGRVQSVTPLAGGTTNSATRGLIFVG